MKTRTKAWVGLVVGVLALVAALQAGNHWGAHDKLCASGAICSALYVPDGIDVRLPAPAWLDARPREIHGFTTTALVRKSCDDDWTIGFGARFEIEDRLEVGDSLSADGACVDAGISEIRGRLLGARVRSGECTVLVPRIHVESGEAVSVAVEAAVDAEAAPACAALVAQSLEIAPELLAQTQLQLTVKYEASVATLMGFVDSEASPGRGPGIRPLLDAVRTSHELKTVGPVAASVRLATAPAAARSPEIVLEALLDEPLRAALPDDIAPSFDASGRLQVRWNVDHEDGVRINDVPVERVPVVTRAAGLGDTAAECTEARENSAQLYFVQVDDQGAPLNAEQLDAVLAAVDSAKNGAGALVTVFVHGWQHSARSGDDYVCSFAALMAANEQMERGAAASARRPARTVVGVYIGWPGELYSNLVANTATTFWDRLAAADRVGAPGAALPRLIGGLVERLPARGTAADRSSTLVLAGHSLGARALFGATRELASERPDLILLINPAFSANLYHQVDERRCTPGVPMLLFSSETDAVTRRIYPAGQSVSYPRTQNPVPFLEHVYTAANFGEFVTHRLRMEIVSGDAPAADGEQTILRGFLRVPERPAASGRAELYNDTVATVYRTPANGRRPTEADAWYRMRLEPVGDLGCAQPTAKVIETDRAIVPDHGTIFTPAFMEYIVRAVNASIGSGD